MHEGGRFDRSRFQDQDSKIYNYVVEKYLLPIQAQIATLLQTKIHLLADDDQPASFASFLEYQVQFEFLHMLWKETGIESSRIEAILEGGQPPDLTVVGLTRRIDLPLLWSVQEQALGLRDSTRLVPSESADGSEMRPAESRTKRACEIPKRLRGKDFMSAT